MKKQFIVGYFLGVMLLAWSVISANFEFLFYSVTVLALIGIVHATDKTFHYNGLVLWGLNLWLVLHILGGLFIVNGYALYSQMLIPIIGEPYNILKYDQIVHAYCYFIVALLLWRVVAHVAKPGVSFGLLATITVLAATGVGGLNEIIEFLATIFIADVNVGGYENTAIDIVSNTLGALLAVPFFQKVTRQK